MTLDDVLDAGHLLQRVDVLGVVPQQLAARLHAADELVAGGRLELARVNLAGELEKWPGIFLKILDVEHGLRVRQVGEVDSEAGVHAVSGSEVRDAAGHGDARAGKDDDVGTVSNQRDAIFQSAYTLQFFPSWRFREQVEKDFPHCHVVKTVRNLTARGEQSFQDVSRVLPSPHGSMKPGQLTRHVRLPVLSGQVRESGQRVIVVLDLGS